MRIEKTSSAASSSTRCPVPEPINASEYKVVWRPDWPAFACPEGEDRAHDFSVSGEFAICLNCFERCPVDEANEWMKWVYKLAAFGSIQDMPTGDNPDFAHMKQMCN